MMGKSDPKEISNRETKDSAFTTYFGKAENAAQLFSALCGEEVLPEDIEFTTLEGVLFVARKNDLAFKVQNRVLVISEHQSTINENMPLRSAIYYGRTMEKLINPKALYRRKRIPIPTPEFYVFYNGDDPFPTEKIVKLSEAYIEKTEYPMLELTVRILNINLPSGNAILERCRPLYEYSWFIQRIKDYVTRNMSRDEAIIQAVKDCEREGILVEFVREHGSEAVNMLFTQWNFDDAMEVGREEAREEGIEIGMEKGEEIALIKMVSRKVQKGKCPEVIAQELEEPLEKIDRICEVLREQGLDMDAEQVYDVLFPEEKQ